MEFPVETRQQLIDVFVGARHCRETARVLTSQGFGTRPEERDKKKFPDERTQSGGVAPNDLGQVLARPGYFGQTLGPRRVERQ